MKKKRNPPVSVRRKTKSGLRIQVRHRSTKAGYANMDLTFLIPWLGSELAAGVARTFESHAAAQQSGSSSYSIRSVLRLWAASQSDVGKWPTAEPEVAKTLPALREQFFRSEFERDIALTTINNSWQQFLSFLRFAAAAGLVPSVDFVRIASTLPKAMVLTDPEEARKGNGNKVLRPKKMIIDEDAFHRDLIIPVSLTLTDEAYIKEYESRLRNALESIRNAALLEISEFRAKAEDGKQLIAHGSYERAVGIFRDENGRRRGGPNKYLDPTNGLHIFNPRGGHPNALQNLLLLVTHEMGGIPKTRLKTVWRKGAYREELVHKDRGHWAFVKEFGKNNLLPYLGILSARTLVPYIVLLLLEHPQLTVSALLRARVSGDANSPALLTPSDSPGGNDRLTLLKPRARAYKSVVLTELSQKLIGEIREWTRSVREALINEGRHQDAQYLWVGIHGSDYRLMRFSEKILASNVRQPEKFRSLGGKKRADRAVSFVDTHPSLEGWRETLTLKSLRVSKGVLVFIETKGDLVATARAFGHKTVQMTLDHYLPKPFQRAIFERQIRRHQNLLVSLAMLDSNQLLQSTDFENYDELHAFFASMNLSYSNLRDLRNEGIWGSGEKKTKAAAPRRRVLMNAEPYVVAVAILYQEHLSRCTDAFRSTAGPDGIVPQMWVDVIASLRAELPDALQQIAGLIRNAETIADRVRGSIRFPGPL